MGRSAFSQFVPPCDLEVKVCLGHRGLLPKWGLGPRCQDGCPCRFSAFSAPGKNVLGFLLCSSSFLKPGFRFPWLPFPPGMCGTIFVPFRAAAVAIDYLFLVPNVYFCSFLAPRTPTRPHSFSVCVSVAIHTFWCVSTS